MDSLKLRTNITTAFLSTIIAASAWSDSRDAGPSDRCILQPQDRWVALGDSITEDGRSQMWVEYYLRARCGWTSFRVINAGLGGDMAGAARRRLSWDVLSSSPSVVSIGFGMNDVGRHLYAKGHSDDGTLATRQHHLQEYESNIRLLVRELTAKGVRVILLTPTPFEHADFLAQTDLPGVDNALVQAGRILAAIGRENQIPVIDLHRALSEQNAELQQHHPGETLIGPDRIHPGGLGQFAIALAFLEGINAPRSFFTVDIDFVEGRVESPALNVRLLELTKRGLAFDVEFPCLPFIAQLSSSLSVSQSKGWSADLLKVRSLPEGTYELRADGQKLGDFSADGLAQGVALDDLAHFPLREKGEQLRKILSKKAAETGKLRLIAWSEHFAYPEGRPDFFSTSDVEERLCALLKNGAQSSPATITRRLDVYTSLKKQEPEIRRKIDSLNEIADGFGIKTDIRFELRLID